MRLQRRKNAMQGGSVSGESGTSPIHVGVLFSQKGHMAVTENAQLRGTLVAIDEINSFGGVNGRSIVPMIEEPGSSPTAYKELARKLLVRDQVSVIFGCCSSASRKALLPLLERYGGILFYPSVYEGFEYCPNVIYTGATPSQTIVPLVEYLFQNYGRKMFLAGSDYIFAREINRITKEFLLESGGTVTGEEYISVGAGDAVFRAVAAKIKGTNPDVILCTVVGEDTAPFYEACHVIGVHPARSPIASLTASEGELEALSPGARAGHITAASYFHGLETPTNRNFVAIYQARYGTHSRPSIYAETAYFQVHLFAEAVAAAGNCDSDQLLGLLRGARITAPQGEIMVDPENNHVYLRPRIGRARDDGGFDIIWEATAAIKPDPYLLTYDRSIAGGR